MTAQSNELAFVDNSFAPEVYADEATGFFLKNGNIAITFCSARVDHRTSPGPMSRVVVGRLVMPVNMTQAFALSLYDFLKNNGLDPQAIVRRKDGEQTN